MESGGPNLSKPTTDHLDKIPSSSPISHKSVASSGHRKKSGDSAGKKEQRTSYKDYLYPPNESALLAENRGLNYLCTTSEEKEARKLLEKCILLERLGFLILAQERTLLGKRNSSTEQTPATTVEETISNLKQRKAADRDEALRKRRQQLENFLSGTQ